MSNISGIKWLVSFLALCGILLFCGFIVLRVQSGYAQNKTTSGDGGEKQTAKTQTGRVSFAAEAKNDSLLKKVLAADNLSYDESSMLTVQKEKSQTLQVSLTNQTDISKKAFSETQPRDTKIFLKQKKTFDKAIARQRSLEFSPTQIFIVALDKNQRVLWWTLENDPRILRLETADEQGRFSNPNVVYLNEADLLFSIPADEEIIETRFYHPVWNGEEYSLEIIGTLDLSKR
jgi:hypothetical protein